MSDQTAGPEGASTDEVVCAAIEPVEAKKFKVVATVAAVLFAPQVLAHVLVPLTVIPTFRSMFDSMGGTVPGPTAVILGLGPFLGLILGVIDGLIFWLCYRLARKYWIGLLFAPLFAGALVAAPLVWALYMPLFDVITLVK